MSGSSPDQQGTSPLYRYAVLAAVFLFASVFATVYLRSRIEQRRQLLARQGVGGSPFGFDSEFDSLMKPPLFDVYLAAEAGTSSIPVSYAGAPREWDEILPLSVSHSAPLPSPPSMPSKDTTPPHDIEPERMFVSVLMRMPQPPSAPSPDDDEASLPYLEIGMAEVDVLRQAMKTVS